MIRVRNEKERRFWGFGRRMHESAWPQARLMEYEGAVWVLKRLSFASETARRCAT
jgi:hypothetical protein